MINPGVNKKVLLNIFCDCIITLAIITIEIRNACYDIQRRCIMKLKLSSKGKYKIVTIYDPLKVISDLAELKKIIENFLKDGEKFIAVNFADASYLYSGAISVLILCYRMIRDQGGNLCIVEPHKRILELLMQINIDSLIDICHDEDDLLTLNVKAESQEMAAHENHPKYI